MVSAVVRGSWKVVVERAGCGRETSCRHKPQDGDWRRDKAARLRAAKNGDPEMGAEPEAAN